MNLLVFLTSECHGLWFSAQILWFLNVFDSLGPGNWERSRFSLPFEWSKLWIFQGPSLPTSPAITVSTLSLCQCHGEPRTDFTTTWYGETRHCDWCDLMWGWDGHSSSMRRQRSGWEIQRFWPFWVWKSTESYGKSPWNPLFWGVRATVWYGCEAAVSSSNGTKVGLLTRLVSLTWESSSFIVVGIWYKYCIYVSMYIYIYICLYTYVYVYKYIHIYMFGTTCQDFPVDETPSHVTYSARHKVAGGSQVSVRLRLTRAEMSRSLRAKDVMEIKIRHDSPDRKFSDFHWITLNIPKFWQTLSLFFRNREGFEKERFRWLRPPASAQKRRLRQVAQHCLFSQQGIMHLMSFHMVMLWCL